MCNKLIKKYFFNKFEIYCSLICSLLCLLVFILFIIFFNTFHSTIFVDSCILFITYLSFTICLGITCCYYYKYKQEYQIGMDNILLDNL